MPTCLRCRRETDAPDAGDVVISLDGPLMLAALRNARRDDLDEDQREMLDRLAAGLCPVCGQAL